MLALNFMLNQYETLKTLSTIAEGSPKPTQYHCTPRELILQSNAGWEKINKDLQKLEQEALVELSNGDTLRVCITQKGLEKIRTLEGRPDNSTTRLQRHFR